MKKFLYQTLFFITLILVFVIISCFLPTTPVRKLNYLQASITKDSLLANVPNPRLIILGGSSVAFGFNCQMIKDSLNINPINTGLHVNIGLKYMLKNSTEHLQQGDTVIICAEYDHYYGKIADGEAELLRIVLDCDLDNAKKLETKQWLHLAKYIPSYIQSKYNMKEYDTETVPFDTYYVYQKTGFNEYGDKVAHWNKKRPIREFYINKRPPVSQVRQEIIDLIKKYIDDAKEKGVMVYIAYPGLYDKEVLESRQNINDLDSLLRANNIPIIGKPMHYMIPKDMLFDTTYHLTKEGADFRTSTFIKDYKEARTIY